jgi:uncharacterized membrane protein YheB (UPF0754 family)
MPIDLSWKLLLFPAIGAVIGAVTNQIAIKMLFRPYAPVIVFGQRLWFTPGVIPAQRHIIASNIATTFEDQLLGGDEIHAALTGPRATGLVEAKVDELMRSLGPLALMAEGFKPVIVEKVISGIEEMALDLVTPGGELDIRLRIEDKINEMDIARLEELILGFSRKQFQHITFFGGVLGFLIGCVQAGMHLWMGG